MANKKTTPIDPFAQVRESVLEAVNTAKAQQDKLNDAAQVEVEKVRTQAVESFDQAVAAYQENFETAVAASKAAAENLTKIEELARTQVTEIAEDRVAGTIKALSVSDPAELMKLQVELVKAEQAKAQALVKETAAIYQGIATQFFGPVQEQFNKAFEQAAKFGKTA